MKLAIQYITVLLQITDTIEIITIDKIKTHFITFLIKGKN